MGIYNIQPINEAWGIAYALNRLPIINKMISFLRNSAGGGYYETTTDGKGGTKYEILPNVIGNYAWTPTRLYNTGVTISHLAHANPSAGGLHTR